MHLHDARIELARERWDPRSPVRARSDDDVVGLEPLSGGFHEVAVAHSGNATDADAGANVEAETRRVCLEIVAHLVLRRERPARGGKAQAGQSVVPRGREQAEGVPARTPGFADPLVRVQDHEWPVPRHQVVSEREAGLTAADDHGLDALRASL